MDVQLILDEENMPLTAEVLGRSMTRLDGAPLGLVGGEVAQKVILINPDDLPGGATADEVTPHFKTLGASASQVIPSGAKGYLATILTGTATINGEAVSAGLSIGSSNTLSATVTIATDASSSAFVAWEV